MAEYLETLLAETEPLRAPIAGDAPGGPDMALEPEFERVKNELEKLTSLEGGEVDWRVVVDTCESLLRDKTKDIRLAVWLTAGGVERAGWPGLARGLAVLRHYLVDMWDHALPKRDKARANIVVWLGERTQPTVADLRIRLEDGDMVRACAQMAEEIDRVLADKLGDGFSGIRGLVQTSRARVNDIPEPPPPPPPPEEKQDSEWADDDDDAPAPAAAAGGVALSTRAEDADATTRTTGEALVALARAMRTADPARAWSYRLHRLGIWLPFEVVIPEDGALGLDGPDAGTQATLRTLLAGARWHELLVAAEEASARWPLWLDAQHLACVALERMGTAFVAAREAAGRDASDFARRSAHLLGVRFADGTPLASAEAVEWLKDEAKRWHAMDGSRAHDVARAEDTEAKRRFAEARNLVAAGRHAEGLAIAVQLARRGQDTRERFRASLDVARLAMNAGAHEIARPILEGLLATAEAHSLETWDPSLCARLYEGLYACLPADAPLRTKVFEVLCRLDPGAALRVRLPAAATNGAPPPPPPAYVTSVQSTSPSSGGATTQAVESEWADDD